MERPRNAEMVARKFQDWARGLTDEEQETLAAWMTRVGGDEVQGYSAYWWSSDDAWSMAMMDSW